MALGRRAGAAGIPRHRRDRLRAADDRAAAQAARSEFGLSQQFDPDLAGEAGRERVRCPARLSASCCSAPAWLPPPLPSLTPPSPVITAMARAGRLNRSQGGMSMRAVRTVWAC